MYLFLDNSERKLEKQYGRSVRQNYKDTVKIYAGYWSEMMSSDLVPWFGVAKPIRQPPLHHQDLQEDWRHKLMRGKNLRTLFTQTGEREKTFKVGLWQGRHEHDVERERGEGRGWVCRKAKIHVSNIWNTSPRARGEREVPGRPAAEHQKRLREERGQEGGTEEREAGTHTPTSLASPFCSAVVISAINWLYVTGPLQWLHIEKQRVNMRILRSITLNQLSAG